MVTIYSEVTHLGNLKNIKDNENAAAIRSAGGKASGKARREKKALKERLTALMAEQAQSDDAIKGLRAAGVEDGTYYDALTAALVQGALHGNAQYMKLVLELLGETGDERRADNKDAREQRLLELKEQQFEKTGILDGAAIPPTIITVHKDGSVDVRGGLENLPILIDNMEFMN